MDNPPKISDNADGLKQPPQTNAEEITPRNDKEDAIDATHNSPAAHKPIIARSPLNKGGRPRVNSVAMVDANLDLNSPQIDDNPIDKSIQQTPVLSDKADKPSPASDKPNNETASEDKNSGEPHPHPADLPPDIAFIDTSILDAVSSKDYPALNHVEMDATLVKESPLQQTHNPPMPALDDPPPALDPANAVTRALNELEQTKTRIGLDVTNVALPKGYRIQEKYEIIGVIGSGGFATVYRALRLHDRQEVAMKIMDLKKCGDQKVSKRFLREAEIAADIHHPNVTKSYDFGYMEDTGQPFIVMELLHGHVLTKELKMNGPFSPKRAFTLFRPVVDALAAGHKIGVVHKDLKPDNFFIVSPGTPNECMKILDYGIAYLKNEAMRLTSDGQIVGTPRYLAPEYIKSRDVSAAIDVYQIALIISEAICGVPAIEGEAFQAMMHHCAGNLSAASFLLYGKVGEVFCKAWAIDPENRYHNCVEFGRALDSIANEFINKTHIDTRVTRITTPEFKPLAENPTPQNALRATIPLPQQSTPQINVYAGKQQLNNKPQKKNNRKTIVILLAILVLITCQGMWYILTKYTSQENPPKQYQQTQPHDNQQPPTAPANAIKTQPSDTGSQPPPPQDIQENQQIPQNAETTVEFLFETEPAGARVLKDSVLICAPTPCQSGFTAQTLEDSTTIQFKLDGYQILNYKLDNHSHDNNKGVIHVDLLKIADNNAPEQKANLVEIQDLCKMASKAVQKGNFCEAYDLYQLAIEKGLKDTECKQNADAIIDKYALQCED